jgi:hypothetical protein
MGHDVSEVTETSSAVELNEKLWVAEDGSVVKDGDPSAAFLIGPAGYRLSREDAIGYGLIKATTAEKKQLDAVAAQPPVFSETDAGLAGETKQKPAASNKQRARKGDK